jgi:hypothetical protein
MTWTYYDRRVNSTGRSAKVKSLDDAQDLYCLSKRYKVSVLLSNAKGNQTPQTIFSSNHHINNISHKPNNVSRSRTTSMQGQDLAFPTSETDRV